MKYGVIFEPVRDEGFPRGYFYAHIPALGLTTQGQGVEGAREAALDLLQLWIAEKQAAHEPIPETSDFFFGTIEVAQQDALQSS